MLILVVPAELVSFKTNRELAALGVIKIPLRTGTIASTVMSPMVSTNMVFFFLELAN